MDTHARLGWKIDWFTVAMVLIGAATIIAAYTLPTPARAADKGGGCCQDLEERVAELEATTARKGNRKMGLTVYGQVNAAVLWHDLDAAALVPEKRVIDGSQSPTVIGVMGEAKIQKNWSAGYRVELEINTRSGEMMAHYRWPDGAWANGASDPVGIRHSYLWLEGPAGRVSLGKTSMATDGIAEISVANTDVAAKMLNLEPLSTNYLGGVNLPFDGSRRNIVRYDSPTMGGIIVSAAWGTGDNIVGFGAVNYANSDIYDIAIRYAGEFGGFRMAAGVGYRKEDFAVFPTGLSGLRNRDSVISGSASLKHMASGLFVNGAYGKVDGEFLTPGGRLDLQGIHAQGGWEKNVTGLGNSTLFAEWAELKAEGADEHPTLMGLGFVQAIDAASMDLYASWRQFDLDGGQGDDDKINVFMAGARVKF